MIDDEVVLKALEILEVVLEKCEEEEVREVVRQNGRMGCAVETLCYHPRGEVAGKAEGVYGRYFDYEKMIV